MRKKTISQSQSTRSPARPALQTPVGIFDSGVGGLTILRELLRELPSERYVYFGDTGNCPYGVRPQEEITQLSLNAAAFLLDRGAKLIVVACNTASSAAIHVLRKTYPQTKFIAVVPAVKPAAAMTHTGRVAVAATNSSAQSDYLRGLITQFANGAEVYSGWLPAAGRAGRRGSARWPRGRATDTRGHRSTAGARYRCADARLHPLPRHARRVRARLRPQRARD